MVEQSKELVTVENDIPLADSRDVAQELDIEHRSFFKLITDYEEEVSKDFGLVRFEIAKTTNDDQGRGRPQRYAKLTEDQTYVYLTYAQNTEKARECKRKFVKAFMEAKNKLAQVQSIFSDLNKWLQQAEQEIGQDAKQLARKERAVSLVRQGRLLWEGNEEIKVLASVRPALTLEQKILGYIKKNQASTDSDKIPTIRNMSRYIKVPTHLLVGCVTDLFNAKVLQKKQVGKAVYFVLTEQRED